MKLRGIEILERDPNVKGDLFGRLMADLFHTLGYDEPRLNVHKSGREIDLTCFHRTEPRMAIAECKAHNETIGGADINKFIGVVDAEKRKLKKARKQKGFGIVGYFISLSGFKETAIEQEDEFDNSRVILIKSDKIVEELVRGRVLVSIENAIINFAYKTDLELLDYADLLAYDNGWVWALYFSNSHGQAPSHLGLVHAEGKPLINSLAQQLVEVDKSHKNLFQGLSLLNNEIIPIQPRPDLETSRQKYFRYLENELGEIQFEGLPTDKEAGSVKVKLENIFVPLHFSKNVERRRKEEFDTDKGARQSIGEILASKTKLAILAKPGGGKSTLIKRIAIAYAFPERRKQINDSLPEKNWFPIFLRCRELGEKVTLSITDIIQGIPARAELQSCSDGFSQLVSTSLQNGHALLLIDGLDEIADDKNRIAFVNQLRTFIATYPTINIIVTSREAGFRVVAGSLASYCENYVVSNLNTSEIEALCLKWHIAIIDDSENTVKEASKLSELILKDIRIKVLAENPLLLTTLLFVKRWAGYLPTKRSVLYQEMIKLLLVTWNVEGHEILDIEEAEPQLAFVAYWMTKNGQQTITAEELNSCLIDARNQMPEILGYTKVSPLEFIRRVESRSSLLIMTGHKRLESGNVVAIYEFLHLSFQEYLTAKAIVKKFIPQADHKDKAVDILKPNINNENWKEVIPLAAVLLERDTKDLIEFLIAESKVIASKDKKDRTKMDKLAPFLLGSCIANEIQISPDILGTAMEWYAKNIHTIRERGVTDIILKNKFGIAFREKIKSCFFDTYDDKHISALGSTLSDIFFNDLSDPDDKAKIPDQILSGLNNETKESKCTAILGMMGFSFSLRPAETSLIKKETLEEIFDRIYPLLKTNDSHYIFSICWSVAWAGDKNIFPDNHRNKFVNSLVKIWCKGGSYNLKRVTSWALFKILTPAVPTKEISRVPKLRAAIVDTFAKPSNEFDKLVSIYLGSIMEIDFDRDQIVEAFNQEVGRKGGEYSNTFKLFASELDISLKK